MRVSLRNIAQPEKILKQALKFLTARGRCRPYVAVNVAQRELRKAEHREHT